MQFRLEWWETVPSAESGVLEEPWGYATIWSCFALFGEEEALVLALGPFYSMTQSMSVTETAHCVEAFLQTNVIQARIMKPPSIEEIQVIL